MRSAGHKKVCTTVSFSSSMTNAIRLRTTEFNMHLLKCQQLALTQISRISKWTEFCAKIRKCLLPSCGYDFRRNGPNDAMVHLSNHFVAPRRVGTICRWDRCGMRTRTKTALLRHLTAAHGIPLCHDSMKQARFCFECSEFFVHEDVWEDHCASHVANPELFCGQIVCRGIIIFARKCMFCLADHNLTAAERYYGFTHASNFFRHLQTHLKSVPHWPLSCPHPNCSIDVATESAFWNHSRTVHGIAKYKLEPNSCAKDATIPTTQEEGMSGLDMTEMYPSSDDATDGDESDDDDTGLGLEASEVFPEKNFSHSCLAKVVPSTPPALSSRGAPRVDGTKYGPSQNGMDHATAAGSTEWKAPGPNIGDLWDTNGLRTAPSHRKHTGTTYSGHTNDITTCTDHFYPQPNSHDESQSLECERMNYDYLYEKGNAISEFPAVEALLQDTQMTTDYGEYGQNAVIQEGDALHSIEAAPISHTITSQAPNDISSCDASPRSFEQYRNLRPLPSQPGRACDEPGCNEVFRFARDLNYHLIEKHGRSHHTCNTSGCGKMFRDAARLREHSQSHSNRKRLTCSIGQCGRTFAQMDTLLRHKQNVHEKERIHVCGMIKDSRTCLSAFDAPWKLKRHKEGVHRCK